MSVKKLDPEHVENLELAAKVKAKLLSALGTNGMLILDNEVLFLIDLIDAFQHGMFDEE